MNPEWLCWMEMVIEGLSELLTATEMLIEMETDAGSEVEIEAEQLVENGVWMGTEGLFEASVEEMVEGVVVLWSEVEVMAEVEMAGVVMGLEVGMQQQAESGLVLEVLVEEVETRAELVLVLQAEVEMELEVGLQQQAESGLVLGVLVEEVKTQAEFVLVLQAEVETWAELVLVLQAEVETRAELVVVLQAEVAEVETRAELVLVLQAEVETWAELVLVLQDEVETRAELVLVLQTEVETRAELVLVLQDEVETRAELVLVLQDEVETRAELVLVLQAEVEMELEVGLQQQVESGLLPVEQVAMGAELVLALWAEVAFEIVMGMELEFEVDQLAVVGMELEFEVDQLAVVGMELEFEVDQLAVVGMGLAFEVDQMAVVGIELEFEVDQLAVVGMELETIMGLEDELLVVEVRLMDRPRRRTRSVSAALPFPGFSLMKTMVLVMFFSEMKMSDWEIAEPSQENEHLQPSYEGNQLMICSTCHPVKYMCEMQRVARAITILKQRVLRHSHHNETVFKSVVFSHSETMSTDPPTELKGLENTTVRELLTAKEDKNGDKSVFWCQTNDSVYDAVKHMTDKNVGSLVVVKPGDEKLLAGIITERGKCNHCFPQRII
ncbi:hypothetical protein ACLOJK_001787 [Asimina triloba]